MSQTRAMDGKQETKKRDKGVCVVVCPTAKVVMLIGFPGMDLGVQGLHSTRSGRSSTHGHRDTNEHVL